MGEWDSGPIFSFRLFSVEGARLSPFFFKGDRYDQEEEDQS